MGKAKLLVDPGQGLQDLARSHIEMIHLLIEPLDILPVLPLLDTAGIHQFDPEPFQGVEKPGDVALDLIQLPQLEILKDEFVVPHQQ